VIIFNNQWLRLLRGKYECSIQFERGLLNDFLTWNTNFIISIGFGESDEVYVQRPKPVNGETSTLKEHAEELKQTKTAFCSRSYCCQSDDIEKIVSDITQIKIGGSGELMVLLNKGSQFGSLSQHLDVKKSYRFEILPL
jgi:hypothetical protein